MVRFEDIRSLVTGWGDDPHPALTFYRGRERVGGLSYAELHGRVDAVAGHLWDMLGLRAGDRIAVLSPNRIEVPVLMLAAMSIGAAVVPLNPTAPPDDWSYILGHSRARGCFAAGDLASRLATDAFVRPIEELA